MGHVASASIPARRDPDEAPQAGAWREDEPQGRREPLEHRRQRPQPTAQAWSRELRGPDAERAQERQVAGVERGRDGCGEDAQQDRRGERVSLVRPGGAPHQQQHIDAAPHDPRDIPGQQRPGQEQRHRPGGVDVGQVGLRRQHRVTARQPDADATPIGSGVGARQLAARDHEHDDHGAREAGQQDREQPPAVMQERIAFRSGRARGIRGSHGAGGFVDGRCHRQRMLRRQGRLAAQRRRGGAGQFTRTQMRARA